MPNGGLIYSVLIRGKPKGRDGARVAVRPPAERQIAEYGGVRPAPNRLAFLSDV